MRQTAVKHLGAATRVRVINRVHPLAARADVSPVPESNRFRVQAASPPIDVDTTPYQSLRQALRTYQSRSSSQIRLSTSRADDRTLGDPTLGNPTATAHLTSSELYESAQLARLAGLCYWPDAELADQLHTEGFSLLTSGCNNFTSWYVCEALSPPASAAPHSDSPSSAGTNEGVRRINQAFVSAPEAGSNGSTARPGAAEGISKPAGSEVKRRLVLFRGVSWRNQQVESLKVWSALMQAWPTPLMGGAGGQPGEIVAHTGIADLALEMYTTLLPYLISAGHKKQQLVFAGHSLGGALAMLVAARARLELKHPAELVRVQTFGSPPVLAQEPSMGASSSVLQTLGLPPSAVRSFVLEGDIVPRSMLASDPSFMLLKRWSVVRSGLQLREWIFGAGVPFSSTRFLYDNVGQVFLISWNAQKGPQVSPLTADALNEALQKATDEFLTLDTQRLLSAWLDHVHSSYSSELEAAAKLQARRASLLSTGNA